MAKHEHEGYCPCIWVNFQNSRLVPFWDLIGGNIVYEKNDLIQTSRYDRIFDSDPIAYNLLSGLIRKNVNADKILVRILCDGNYQHFSDIQKVLSEANAPQLIAYPESKFIAILSNADYGLDLWIWDLTVTQ